MRHTVRALRLAIAVLWIAVLLTPVTVALSLREIFEARNNVAIGKPSFSMSDENLLISLPFFINNTGFYDISELFAKIRVYDEGEEIAEFSTQPLNIPARRTVESSLNASCNLAEVISKDAELLTDSKDLDVCVALHFHVAHILAFKIARNFTYRWDAPFSNLTVNYTRVNAMHVFSVSFYNNALFPLSGPLKVELFNLQNVCIGSAVQILDVAPNEYYQCSFIFEAVEIADMIRLIRISFADMLVVERRWGSS